MAEQIYKVEKPVSVESRRLVKYVTGLLYNDFDKEEIKKIVKAINKALIKKDLDGKEVTFDFIVRDDEVVIKNVKVWEPKDTPFDELIEKL